MSRPRVDRQTHVALDTAQRRWVSLVKKREVTRRFDADVGVHICEGNTLKKGGQGRDRTVDLPIFSPVDFVPKDVFWLQKIDFPGFLTVKSVIRTRGILHVL